MFNIHKISSSFSNLSAPLRIFLPAATVRWEGGLIICPTICRALGLLRSVAIFAAHADHAMEVMGGSGGR